MTALVQQPFTGMIGQQQMLCTPISTQQSAAMMGPCRVDRNRLPPGVIEQRIVARQVIPYAAGVGPLACDRIGGTRSYGDLLGLCNPFTKPLYPRYTEMGVPIVNVPGVGSTACTEIVCTPAGLPMAPSMAPTMGYASTAGVPVAVAPPPIGYDPALKGTARYSGVPAKGRKQVQQPKVVAPVAPPGYQFVGGQLVSVPMVVADLRNPYYDTSLAAAPVTGRAARQQRQRKPSGTTGLGAYAAGAQQQVCYPAVPVVQYAYPTAVCAPGQAAAVTSFAAPTTYAQPVVTSGVGGFGGAQPAIAGTGGQTVTSGVGGFGGAQPATGGLGGYGGAQPAGAALGASGFPQQAAQTVGMQAAQQAVSTIPTGAGAGGASTAAAPAAAGGPSLTPF